MNKKPTGLLPAVHTPFDSAGNINLSVVSEQADRLIEMQCGGVYVGGTTGECYSLTCEERIALADAWFDAASDTDLSLVVHVGDNCIRNAQTLAAQAESRGADAIAAMAPCFFRPQTHDVLIAYLREISSAAPNTPFYFYDIPIMTHVELSMVEFLKRCQTEFPNLAGLKFTNDNLLDLQDMLRIAPDRYNILFGFDEIMSSAWAFGVRGAVGSTYNQFAKLYNAIIAAFETGDQSRVVELQNLSVDIIRVFQKHGFLATSKEVMKLVGIDCGTVRSPVLPLREGELDEIASSLESLGAMQWV